MERIDDFRCHKAIMKDIRNQLQWKRLGKIFNKDKMLMLLHIGPYEEWKLWVQMCRCHDVKCESIGFYISMTNSNIKRQFTPMDGFMSCLQLNRSTLQQHYSGWANLKPLNKRSVFFLFLLEVLEMKRKRTQVSKLLLKNGKRNKILFFYFFRWCECFQTISLVS